MPPKKRNPKPKDLQDVPAWKPIHRRTPARRCQNLSTDEERREAQATPPPSTSGSQKTKEDYQALEMKPQAVKNAEEESIRNSPTPLADTATSFADTAEFKIPSKKKIKRNLPTSSCSPASRPEPKIKIPANANKSGKRSTHIHAARDSYDQDKTRPRLDYPEWTHHAETRNKRTPSRLQNKRRRVLPRLLPEDRVGIQPHEGEALNPIIDAYEAGASRCLACANADTTVVGQRVPRWLNKGNADTDAISGRRNDRRPTCQDANTKHVGERLSRRFADIPVKNAYTGAEDT
ncbi:hypothetical protein ACJJTC_004163 [Scirpophaga incertulas]